MYFKRIGTSDKGENMYFNRINNSDKGDNDWYQTETISLFKFSPSIVMRPKSRPAETATPALPYSRIHPLSIFFQQAIKDRERRRLTNSTTIGVATVLLCLFSSTVLKTVSVVL